MGFPKVNDQMRLAEPKAKTATSEDQWCKLEFAQMQTWRVYKP